MLADTPEPVAGVIGIAFHAMHNAVPVGPIAGLRTGAADRALPSGNEVEKHSAERGFGIAGIGKQSAGIGIHQPVTSLLRPVQSKDVGDLRAVTGGVEGQLNKMISDQARSLALPLASATSYNKRFMPVFRIHRMKDAPRQQFRSAAHVSGPANVKPRDYEAAAEIEADNEYAAWALLRNTEAPLNVGDLLEATSDNRLRICKYVGFEEARWFVPEPPPQASLPAPLSGAPPVTAPEQQQAQA